MKLVIVVVGVLFTALYGFRLSLPTAHGDFEVRTGLKRNASPTVVIPEATPLVDDMES